ncbi:LLM class flavin-dependent oxidoreductase [Nocardioides sp. zg-DK7169]|uniref:LLM class flavin-dependent oxidoreductase n=1 Tax=Nocardioides sp. zg-DK7169 TaxID=2736600 RepID=UPI00155807EA|nr:LLM class flavin-dependent oxidoreductase [Nocardioides sp. zg-DK7169]NPC97208.1 LLM class flavin-dependent oxidoreductase [Nocardioides sp. zg-DK7169]
MASFAARYDLRAPGATPAERHELYTRAVEQAAYVDAHGLDALMVSEHHVAEDGYLPSPLLLASAFAAVTRRVPITVSALLVNLYEPVRLAEDLAVLDHLSGGRVSYTVGLGYRREEYDVHGRPWSTRGRDLEERLVELLRLWREGVTTPGPFSDPHPVLFYGGGTPAAARRAARLGLHFQPQHADPALRETYEQACRDAGHEPGMVLTTPRTGPANVFCTPDPEEFWERWGHHLLADATSYQQWHGEAASHVLDPSRTVEEMRAAGVYLVLTPDDLVERIRAREVRLVTSHPACGGLPAEPSWTSLRLVCETVLPAVRG